MKAVDAASIQTELDSTRNALQAARLELELAKGREQKLLSELRVYGAVLSDNVTHASHAGRYALLTAIGGLAGWQVYLTLKLQLLLT